MEKGKRRVTDLLFPVIVLVQWTLTGVVLQMDTYIDLRRHRHHEMLHIYNCSHWIKCTGSWKYSHGLNLLEKSQHLQSSIFLFENFAIQLVLLSGSHLVGSCVTPTCPQQLHSHCLRRQGQGQGQGRAEWKAPGTDGASGMCWPVRKSYDQHLELVSCLRVSCLKSAPIFPPSKNTDAPPHSRADCGIPYVHHISARDAVRLQIPEGTRGCGTDREPPHRSALVTKS